MNARKQGLCKNGGNHEPKSSVKGNVVKISSYKKKGGTGQEIISDRELKLRKKAHKKKRVKKEDKTNLRGTKAENTRGH